MKQPIIDAIGQCKKSPATLINADLVDLAFMMAGAVKHQDLLDMFIQRTHTHWTLIARSQDVATVLEPVLAGFEEMGVDRIQEILRVVKDGDVDTEIQKKLLTLGRSLVKIALRHLNEKPMPGTTIDVHAMAKLFALDLSK